MRLIFRFTFLTRLCEQTAWCQTRDQENGTYYLLVPVIDQWFVPYRFATTSGVSILVPRVRFTASLMYCAIDHAKGVAEPAPSPKANAEFGLSQICSGIISPSFAKPVIASRRLRAIDRQLAGGFVLIACFCPQAAISYSPRSPLSSAQRCPWPVYFRSQFQGLPSYISP